MAQLNQNPLEHLGPEKMSVGWPWKFFVFTLILIFMVVLGYVGLSFGYRPFMESQIAEIESNLQKISKDITEVDKENLILTYSQQENLRKIIMGRIYASKIFPLMQKITHPKVYYSGLDLVLSEKKLELEGSAESYGVLSEQLAFYDKEESIVRYNLEDSVIREGTVMFKVALTLADSLLK
jgi:hypothetical protein